MHVRRKLGLDSCIVVHRVLGYEKRAGDLVCLYTSQYDGLGHSFHQETLPLSPTFRRVSRCGLVHRTGYSLVDILLQILWDSSHSVQSSPFALSHYCAPSWFS